MSLIAAKKQETFIMTKLAFRNRFTFAEKVAIENAAETDNEVKVVLKDQEAASFINLKDENTENGLNLLSSKGLIDSSRVNEILNNPISDIERPSKG